ncbi:MAG: sulfate transporter CysZ [Gammaproteobacteria bacterium]|nr:sulfate transporter CysZ [Gammaproteobacteria bacterium]MCZ6717396.1 sulfate transporter CysZ [Gammaproteobacteria bacterium]MCZ6827680.1 sulfate transporter CysZ [Gammaproteobacteria bacterium]MCZ6912306.1 sulfate transporter CysZ [Pseudomonadota bacterium]
MHDFLTGLKYGFRGLPWLWRKGVRLYVVVPLLINSLLFAVAIIWAGSRIDGMVSRLQDAAPGYLDWIIWLLWPVFVLLALLGLFFGFTLLANLIGSPFNGLLAERVERLVDPESHPPDSLSLVTELFSAPLEELRKLMHVFLLAVPLILLWLVPPAYPFLPFLWAAFGAWVLALEYLDYPLSNWNLTTRRQRALLRKRRMLALGFGSGVTVLTTIPVLNFVAMPAAVIGGTLLWSEQLKMEILAGGGDDESG